MSWEDECLSGFYDDEFQKHNFLFTSVTKNADYAWKISYGLEISNTYIKEKPADNEEDTQN